SLWWASIVVSLRASYPCHSAVPPHVDPVSLRERGKWKGGPCGLPPTLAHTLSPLGARGSRDPWVCTRQVRPWAPCPTRRRRAATAPRVPRLCPGGRGRGGSRRWRSFGC